MRPESRRSVLLTQEIDAAWVRCRNCHRQRLWRDIFWHVEDRAFYCANTIACELRFVVQSEREDQAAV